VVKQRFKPDLRQPLAALNKYLTEMELLSFLTGYRGWHCLTDQPPDDEAYGKIGPTERQI
jgi:hypothetical protein